MNILKTGNLPSEIAFVGDTATTPRVVNATYICRHWNDPNDDPGWRPNNYHAMYTTMKGLTSLDIHEICGYDWQAEFKDTIVAQQNANGGQVACGETQSCAQSGLCLPCKRQLLHQDPLPAAVPALTPIGLIALAGLLSVIAVICISFYL